MADRHSATEAGWLTEAVTGWLGHDRLGPVILLLVALSLAFALYRAWVKLSGPSTRLPPRVMLDDRDLPPH